ncbi:MAG: zinc ribbon domain-containing protein [Bacilli bacterium]|nr:zinc ribbon domain-containing protein [Bacilli bacterium]
MALIKCPECGKEISDTVKQCINCGYEINGNNGGDTPKQSMVIIHGYQETFAVNPPVKIYIDGNYVAEVGKGQTISLPIDHDCVLTFKSSIRSTDVKVFLNNNTEIMLSFNRGSGALKAITNIQTDNPEVNSINQQNYEKEVSKTKSSSIFWIIFAIICILVAVFLL